MPDMIDDEAAHADTTDQENRSANKILTATVKWGAIFILRNA
jgi:hypothetical protein